MQTFKEYVLGLKRQGYTKVEALKKCYLLYEKKHRKWGVKATREFDEAWQEKVEINATLDEIIDKFDLPSDLHKLKSNQETQIINYYRHKDKAEVKRVYRLLGIIINVATKNHKKKVADNAKIVSDLIYQIILHGGSQ